MKEKLKFVPALMHALAFVFGGIILSFVRFGGVEISIFDIARMGFGKYNDSFVAEEASAVFRIYAKPYVFAILFLMIVVLITIILNCALKRKSAYIAGIIGQIVMGITMAVLYFSIRRRFVGTIRQTMDYFGLGSAIQFYSLPVAVWILLETAALVLNIVGIVLCGQKKEVMTNREIYIDNIPNGSNAPRKSFAEEEYYGTIVGVTGGYAGMAYPLRKLELVYVCEERDQVVVKREKPRVGLLAQLYYIPQYKEYCVRPAQKMQVFMESGQPLGNSREYYLPRGTKIYLKDRQNLFELA